MAADFDSRLSTIKAKAQLLAERYNLIAAERRELLVKVEELQSQLLSANKTIETLKAKVEYLQLATTILPSSDDLEHSRRFLTELVWEIDKCITQLSE